jgi:FkbM family methyltransferase
MSHINKLKLEKKKMEEKKTKFDYDLELYEKFKKMKEQDFSFDVPVMFKNIYDLFEKLDNNGDLSFESFIENYVEEKMLTQYDDMFTVEPYAYKLPVPEDFKSDNIIIDGGANLGFHSIQFAKLANQGKVYSFEPQPLIFNVLSTNVLINGATDVIKQFRLGLSNKEEDLKMSPLKEQIFSEDCINYGGRGLTDSNEGEEEVQLTNIDNLNLSKLDLIKLDVQGFELKTLLGGKNTISTHHPIIFIENYLNLEDDKNVIKLLEKWGYQIYRLLCTENQEDCIALYPSTHIEEIKFIESQNIIKWKK